MVMGNACSLVSDRQTNRPCITGRRRESNPQPSESGCGITSYHLGNVQSLRKFAKHDSDIAVLCAGFSNELTKMDVPDVRVFTIFDMDFGWKYFAKGFKSAWYLCDLTGG